jgi:hypothetical protein
MLQAEKIHETLNLAILQGPLNMKIGVVTFCTMPLVHFTKNTCLPLLATNKMKIYFLCGNSRNPSYESCSQWKDAHLC